MIKREDFYFDSRDQLSKVHAVKWIPQEKPFCILQIIHGMSEYILRYQPFAEFMAEKGILVVGDDHLGHGESVGKEGTQGYFCERDSATVVVRDEHRLKKIIQEEYPGIPYYVLGHSMGSFICRNYIARYGTGIQGAIIMGTGMQKKSDLFLLRALIGIQKFFLGSRHPAKLIDKIASSHYLDGIENVRTASDWLTTDNDVVDRYIEDKDCGFLFTVNGYQTLHDLIKPLHKDSEIQKIPKNLPVFFVYGECDPIGGWGKDVKQVYESYKAAEIEDLTIKGYPQMRHEILNEKDRAQVYDDLLKWLEQHIQTI